jgi:hypothetical protein
MSISFVFFVAVAVLLAVLLIWAVRDPRPRRLPSLDSIAGPTSEPHAARFPQIRQALQRDDLAFAALHGSRGLSRRMQRQRHRVVLAYLRALESDFQGLLRLAQAIATLSPEIDAAHEMRRMRLNIEFGLRLRLIRMQLALGLPALPQLGNLGNLVSGLTMQMKSAMELLGERAALAAEMASLKGTGMNAA